MESKKNNGAPAIQSPVIHDIFQRDTGILGCRSAPLLFVICLFMTITATGCRSTLGNAGDIRNYPLSSIEAEWIRNGEPIEFEGELWYPVDGVESFLDSEMRLVGKQKGVEFFTDKVDVRPFSRVYTKFGKNKFRFFERKINE